MGSRVRGNDGKGQRSKIVHCNGLGSRGGGKDGGKGWNDGTAGAARRPPPRVWGSAERGGSAGGVDQLAEQLDDVGGLVEPGLDQQLWAAEPLSGPDLQLVGEQH